MAQQRLMGRVPKMRTNRFVQSTGNVQRFPAFQVPSKPFGRDDAILDLLFRQCPLFEPHPLELAPALRLVIQPRLHCLCSSHDGGYSSLVVRRTKPRILTMVTYHTPAPQFSVNHPVAAAPSVRAVMG